MPTASHLPNLLLAGVPKAATTAVAAALGASSEVDPGETKEPGILGNATYDDRQVEHLYNRHFAGKSYRFRLDATPWAIYSDLAFRRLVGSSGARGPVPVLVMLREPWSRMESMYLDQVRRGRERRSFDVALLEGESDVAATEQPITLDYVGTSLYGEHLARWARANQVDLRIGYFDDVIDDTRRDQLERSIEDWLDTPIGAIQAANSRSDGTSQLAGAVDRAVRAGSLLPPSIRARLRPPLARVARLVLDRTPRRRSGSDELLSCQDAALRSRLDARFAEDAARIREIAASGTNLLPIAPAWVLGPSTPPQ